MAKKLYILTAFLMVVALVLSACEKSMTNASAATPTSKRSNNTPAATGAGGATENPITLLYQYATQTAMAGGGTPLANQTPGGTETTPGGPTANPNLPTLTPTLYNAVPTYTPGPRPATYITQSGEWAYCIARRFNVNPEEMLVLSGLSDGNLILPGQVLIIPQSGNPFPGPRTLIPHPAMYTVQSGDTIYGIACAYGDVYPEVIAQVNGLQPPYTLTVGSKLQIP